MNDLFDSVNGQNLPDDPPLRRLITDTSSHHDFWDEALQKLRYMKFVDRKTGKKSYVVKTIQNWEITILSFKALWNNLKSDGFTKLKGRSINQDRLKTFLAKYGLCDIVI